MHETDSKIPHSIGIIMDGNRRYAKEHGMSTFEGHKAGYEKIKEVLTWAQEAGVKEMIIYAFSTENWNRSEEEVSYLMELLDAAFSTGIKDIIKKGVRVRCIGDRARLPLSMQEKIAKVEADTKDAPSGTLAIALSYGGREEILSAVNALLVEGREVVTEEELSGAMWSAGLADPDLIIRTSGEQRLSNFLPWQSVYSELFFTDTKWPAFTQEEFTNILAEYAARDRRRGK